jgi:cysteine-rich repeat protein
MTQNLKKSGSSEITILFILLIVFLIGLTIFLTLIFKQPSSNQQHQSLTSDDSQDSDALVQGLSFLNFNNMAKDCLYAAGHDLDTDSDGIVDSCDNCQFYYNPFQEDSNSNGLGDVCDLIPERRHMNSTNNTEDIECHKNSDCGTDGYTGSAFCSQGKVVKLYKTYTCSDKGTVDSSCSSKTEERIIESCANGCQNGMCIILFPCNQDSDCNDNNAYTEDKCINPGTPQSYCEHNPIFCFTSSDCGTNGFIGDPFCSTNLILKLFKTYSCSNAGTSNSFCSSTNSTQQINSCQYACLEGSCIRCHENSDCNDNDSSTTDICVSPGTINSSCQNSPTNSTECTPGETKQCGTSEVGVCEFGTQTCNSNGFWGACIGAINPLLEICDGLDNNCNGQIDEGGVCPPTPVCGNHILESGEQCDDGNTINGDGCSSTCTIEQPICQNQCVNGQRQCLTDDSYQVCRDYNGDGCTEWQAIPSTCGFGKSCNGGYCI